MQPGIDLPPAEGANISEDRDTTIVKVPLGGPQGQECLLTRQVRFAVCGSTDTDRYTWV